MSASLTFQERQKSSLDLEEFVNQTPCNIYTTSEKPVNDQSYGGVGSLRYNDTIQVKQL